MAKTAADLASMEEVWAVLVCVALSPFGWLVRCRACWRGRWRTVVGQHQDHLRVLWVCPVCHAVRPIPEWLQPGRPRDNIPV
jgi:hypothetical protein